MDKFIRSTRARNSRSKKSTRSKRNTKLLNKRASYVQDIQSVNKYLAEIDTAIINQHLVANTFCVINLHDMIKYNLKGVNTYFQKKNNECGVVETGNTSGNPITDNWILHDESFFLILVMKYNLVEIIQKNPVKLNQPDILEQIVGHAIIQVDTPKKMIGIFSVCSHKLNESGHGTEIMNIILLSIEFKYKKDYTLWLGILMNNRYFEKVAKLYTSVGFQDPYISNIDYFGNNYRGLNLMFLTKSLHENSTEERIHTNYNILMHMFKQYHGKNRCTFHFQFDNSVLLKGKLIPFLSIGGGISAVPETRENFPEYGGTFNIVHSKIENNDIIFKMGLGEYSDFKNLTVGTVGSVQPPISLFNFHIHPYKINQENGWIMNCPSPGDLNYFFYYAVVLKKLYFHTLIAIEGIYVISLSKSFIDNYSMNKMNDYMKLDSNYFAQNFQYPVNLLAFSQTHKSDLEKYVKDYLHWFERTNKNHYDILEVQYFSWNTLKNKDLKISIHYLSTEEKVCHMNQYGIAFDPSDPNFMNITP